MMLEAKTKGPPAPDAVECSHFLTVMHHSINDRSANWREQAQKVLDLLHRRLLHVEYAVRSDEAPIAEVDPQEMAALRESLTRSNEMVRMLQRDNADLEHQLRECKESRERFIASHNRSVSEVRAETYEAAVVMVEEMGGGPELAERLRVRARASRKAAET